MVEGPGQRFGVTFESYERIIRNHTKPALYHRKLKNLAPYHVQYFYQQKLDAGLALGTVRLMHGILHKALAQAVKRLADYKKVKKLHEPKA